MHLGYHELRNLLNKFREEREKRKTTGGTAQAARVEYRRDEHRDRERDRGYERHSS